MKTTTLAVASLLGFATAFPHIQAEVENRRRQAVPATKPFPAHGGVARVPGSIKFDEAAQLVSVDGEHRFIAPLPTDQRGPCAGLNAAANHGYIPRNGIADVDGITLGLYKAFGLSNDSTQFLHATTAYFDGDSITRKWSIGGYSDLTYFNNGTLKEFGLESGICMLGHLKSEGDASITRGDWLDDTNNDNCLSYPNLFQDLLNLGCKNDKDCNIDMATLAEHQHNRKLHSIAHNRNYVAPAFAGVVFTPAAHHFVFALMSNHSEEYPEGILDPATLMAYEYAADGKTLIYTPGHERIPEDWYKRAIGDEWTLADITAGITQQCQAYPTTCHIGGNKGEVNSFYGIDLEDLSGGAFNALALTDPYQLGCFISQTIQAEASDQTNLLIQGPHVQAALDLLVGSLAEGFGACNGINARGGAAAPRQKGKPMSAYADIIPGANRTGYALANPDRKFSPAPGA